MENIKIIIGENIAELRKRKNLTQQELADILIYSDKSISKWERGESTPDIEVLLKIAELFEVSINYLLETHDEKEKEARIKSSRRMYSYKIIISAISCVALWFLVAVLYTALFSVNKINVWILFIWAIPATFILLLIFTCVWAKPKWIFLVLTPLLWTFITSFFLTTLIYAKLNIWYLYIVGIPLQIAIILSSLLTRKK